ncbi:DNA-formamidopyrimidine glycosylase family protein [Pseudonocardia adelaidensis]|uniref:DNA-formamidopyrimidine glycosylase family protein n=1 Tax=Pseudonocardia adelaidensis TaxID=648754 RepID=UPI0031E63A30
MPELPEVESARTVIERAALGRCIATVDDSGSYVCRPHPPGQIRDALVGRRLVRACRLGEPSAAPRPPWTGRQPSSTTPDSPGNVREDHHRRRRRHRDRRRRLLGGLPHTGRLPVVPASASRSTTVYR